MFKCCNCGRFDDSEPYLYCGVAPICWRCADDLFGLVGYDK